MKTAMLHEFPLIKQLGLAIKTLPHTSTQLVYADDLERALEAAKLASGTVKNIEFVCVKK